MMGVLILLVILTILSSFKCITTGQYDIFYYGDPAINRTHVDGWTNGIYMPEPHKSIPKYGTLIGWKVYFRSVKPITCQIWRPATKPNYYKLIGQTVFTPSASGVQQTDLTRSFQFSVNSGDLVGFYFGNGSTIPFTNYTTDCTGIEFTKYIYPASPKTAGSAYPFKEKLHWGPCRKYSIQAIIKFADTNGRSVHDVAFYKPCTKFPKMMNKNAGLAVDEKGETCTYLSNSTTWSVDLTSARTVMDVNISGYVYKFDKALGYLQSVNAKLESKGRLVIFAPNQNLTDVSSGEWYLTKWQVYLQRWFQSNPLVLQLWRPSGKDTYRLVHSHTVALRKKMIGKLKFVLPIPQRVHGGEVVGFYFKRKMDMIPFTYSDSCSNAELFRYRSNPKTDLNIGESYVFMVNATEWPCRKYSVKAIIQQQQELTTSYMKVQMKLKNSDVKCVMSNHSGTCGPTIADQVTITSLSTTLRLCDVKVYECADGFGGEKCQPCSCQYYEYCHKIFGNCSEKCSFGKGGRDCKNDVFDIRVTSLTSGTIQVIWKDDNYNSTELVYDVIISKTDQFRPNETIIELRNQTSPLNVTDQMMDTLAYVKVIQKSQNETILDMRVAYIKVKEGELIYQPPQSLPMVMGCIFGISAVAVIVLVPLVVVLFRRRKKRRRDIVIDDTFTQLHAKDMAENPDADVNDYQSPDAGEYESLAVKNRDTNENNTQVYTSLTPMLERSGTYANATPVRSSEATPEKQTDKNKGNTGRRYKPKKKKVPTATLR